MTRTVILDNKTLMLFPLVGGERSPKWENRPTYHTIRATDKIRVNYREFLDKAGNKKRSAAFALKYNLLILGRPAKDYRMIAHSHYVVCAPTVDSILAGRAIISNPTDNTFDRATRQVVLTGDFCYLPHISNLNPSQLRDLEEYKQAVGFTIYDQLDNQ